MTCYCFWIKVQQYQQLQTHDKLHIIKLNKGFHGYNHWTYKLINFFPILTAISNQVSTTQVVRKQIGQFVVRRCNVCVKDRLWITCSNCCVEYIKIYTCTKEREKHACTKVCSLCSMHFLGLFYLCEAKCKTVYRVIFAPCTVSNRLEFVQTQNV